MTLLTQAHDIGDRVTDPVTGFRAPDGGDNRQWFRCFDQLTDIRRQAIEANAHDITVLVDTIVLYANAHGDNLRDAWRKAYEALRAAIACERGTE